MPGAQMFQQIESVGSTQRNIENDDIWIGAVDGLQGRVHFLRYAANGKVAFLVNEKCETLTNNGMIIDHEDLIFPELLRDCHDFNLWRLSLQREVAGYKG